MTKPEWIVTLPFTTPLNLNDRMHWALKAKLTKQWREATCWLTRAQRIPNLKRVRVELHYVPRDSRRRDRDNPVAAMKACCDGVVDAGVVPDDTDVYMERGWPVIHPKGPEAAPGSRVWLVITDVSSGNPATA